MSFFETLCLLALVGWAAARQCSNFLIPVDITSRQGLFKKVPVEDNLDVGAFAIRFNVFQKNYTAELLEGYQTLVGSYNISAQYCRPDGGSGRVIQVLTHGIGFDKTYWDLKFDDYKYSYVNNALENGYSTLAIDRLGIGQSSHGDPFNEIQAQAEVEALNSVTIQLRNGDIHEVEETYEKIIHVGHSFGAVQSSWLSSLYPDNTDGVILTGYSGVGQFLPYIVAGWNLHSARLNQPFRFGNQSNASIRKLAQEYGLIQDILPGLQSGLEAIGIDLPREDLESIFVSTEILDLTTGYNGTSAPLNYPSGYFASSDLTALKYAFLYPDNYDLNLAIVGEQTKQPVTAGELLTIATGPTASAFAGPVLVITGEQDVPFCGGNCLAVLPDTALPNIPAGVQKAFPSASAFESYIQPATGHGLTFHYNATAGYQVIQDFLGRNGLGA